MFPNPLIAIPKLQHAGNDSWEHHRGMGVAGDWHKTYENQGAKVYSAPTTVHDDFGEAGYSAPRSFIPEARSHGQGEEAFQMYEGGIESNIQQGKRTPIVAPNAKFGDSISSTTDYTDSYDIEGSMYGDYVHPKDQKYNTAGVNGALSDSSGLSKEQGNLLVEEKEEVVAPKPYTSEQWLAEGYEMVGGRWEYTGGGDEEAATRADAVRIGKEAAGKKDSTIIDPLDERFTKPTSKIGPDIATADAIYPFLDYEKRGAFVSDQFGGWDEARWAKEISHYQKGAGMLGDELLGTEALKGIPNKNDLDERWSLRGRLFHGSSNDTPYDLTQAIKNFEASGEVTIEAETSMAKFAQAYLSVDGEPMSPFRDIDVRKDVLYTDLRNQGASDAFIKKYFGVEITNKMRSDYSNIAKDTAVATGPGSMDTRVRAYTANINNSVAALNAGGLDTSQTDDLISMLSQEVVMPEGYEVLRDEAGQPSVRWIGKLTGKSQTIGEGDMMQTTAERDMTQGRLSTRDEQALNNALQTREQGQVAIQNYIQGKLGLSLDRERAGIISEEFTQSLNFERDKLTLDRDQFLSNESLSKATVTGIFEDKPTLSAQELMGKLTGRVQTGTRNEFDPEGGLTQVPVMADTVEMRKLRAELIGQFEGKPTITREQFEAAVFGRIGDKSTFARDQWDAEQSRIRNDALLAAGKVVTKNFIIEQEVYNEKTKKMETVRTEAGKVLDSLEAQRLMLDERLATAQLNGLRSITVSVLDKQGKPTDDTELREVSWIESQRLVIDQQRLDHLMAMEAAAQTGKMTVQKEDEEGEMADVEVETIEGRKMTLEERMFQAQQDAMVGFIRTYDSEGVETGKLDTIASENVQDRMRAQALKDERAGLEQMGGPTDSPEGVAYARKQHDLRTSYMSSLNSGLTSATVEDTSSLESALGATLPPSPAGMVWDAQGGVFRLRSGYEGRDIDPYTQRAIEAVAPILRARDRAERVLLKLQEDRFEFEQTLRMLDEQELRLRNALNNGDIETAEEVAHEKSKAETAHILQQTKNEKYTMLFQLMSNPVALGMADRHGILDLIKQDIPGLVIPHVPQAPSDANTIPNVNEWQALTPEDKAFRIALWTTETGGSSETFLELISQTLPAEMNQVQYSTF